MGLFNFFGKKGNDLPKGSNDGLDMNNPVIAEMVHWIEHPMEFNRRPESISIIASRDLYCPTQRVDKCHLLKFTMSGDKEYIGFTGSITWCFIGIDFNALTTDELFLRYIGWFVAFVYLNSDGYDKSLEGSNWKSTLKGLTEEGYKDITILQNVCMAKENYYELSANLDGTPVKLAGTKDNMTQYNKDHILPFYDAIGHVWGPFNTEE